MALLGQIRRARQSKDTLHHVNLLMKESRGCSVTHLREHTPAPSSTHSLRRLRPMAWSRMPGCVGYYANYRQQRRLKTLRRFCLGICAYQKYLQFRFPDYLGLMAPLRLMTE